jgi:Zn ribbon nucleic-acid-binding protein
MALAEIQLALNSIKTAVDIGAFIAKSDNALDRALLKVKIEEIIDSLSEAKKTIRDLDDVIYEKDKLIKELQEKANIKTKTVGYLGARYCLNSDNEPTGVPYCPTCWADDQSLNPLTAWSNNEATHKCGKCGNTIQSRLSPLNADQYIKANREAAEKMKMPFTIETYL